MLQGNSRLDATVLTRTAGDIIPVLLVLPRNDGLSNTKHHNCLQSSLAKIQNFNELVPSKNFSAKLRMGSHVY